PEVIEPSPAPVRRGCLSHARQSAAKTHQQPKSYTWDLQNDVLNIHALDSIYTIGIHLCRHAAGRKSNFLHRLAGNGHFASAHVKRSHILEGDRCLDATREQRYSCKRKRDFHLSPPLMPKATAR